MNKIIFVKKKLQISNDLEWFYCELYSKSSLFSADVGSGSCWKD